MIERISELRLPSSGQVRSFSIQLGGISQEEEKCSWDLLGSDERARAEKFIFQKDRQRYVLVYGAIKRILGDLLGQSPQRLSFSRSKFGKPFLPEYPLHFNLSHAAEWAFLGVHPSLPIGVDIEKEGASYLPDSFLDETEKNWLSSSGVSWADGTLLLWSAKEAYLKALGIGFSAAMPTLEAIKSNAQDVTSFIGRLSTQFPALRVLTYESAIFQHKLALCT